MNKLKNLILWLMIVGYMVLALGFVSRGNDAVRCTGVKILIRDSLKLQFILKEDVMRILNEAGDSLVGKDMSKLELSQLEELLLLHPAVKSAEIFTTIDGEVRVEIRQRRPVVRIIDRNSRNYYIDDEGYFMPVTRNHSEHVLVINGNINPGVFNAGAMHLLDNEPDRELVNGLFNIARYIHQDEFWHSQIVQVYVNSRKELELIPRMGAHIIYFGNSEDYIHKLFKLETVYQEGFRFLGWNQYEKIDLTYKNQVVCTKK